MKNTFSVEGKELEVTARRHAEHRHVVVLEVERGGKKYAHQVTLSEEHEWTEEEIRKMINAESQQFVESIARRAKIDEHLKGIIGEES